MHETLSPNFKGYIDNFFLEEDNVRISGWIICLQNRDDATLGLNVGHDINFYNYNQRQDVADFYKTNDSNYVNCGFDICIPYRNDGNYVIFADVNGNREEIFKLSLNGDRQYTPETNLIDEKTSININYKAIPSFVVVDDFYQDPHEVRNIALSQTFNPDLRYHKGKRTEKKFLAQGTKEYFESLIGRKITNWVNYEYNGIFQYCTAEDPLVYHVDTQSYAGAVYLTPDAPVDTGTSFYRSKTHKDIRKLNLNDSSYNEVFKNGYYDRTQFELIDTVGNVFNRLVLWDSRLIHSASQYFGNSIDNGRLFHLFFFDIEE